MEFPPIDSSANVAGMGELMDVDNKNFAHELEKQIVDEYGDDNEPEEETVAEEYEKRLREMESSSGVSLGSSTETVAAAPNFEQAAFSAPMGGLSAPNYQPPPMPQSFDTFTQEQKEQKFLHDALSQYNTNEEVDFSLDKEKARDKLSMRLTQIELLRRNLRDDDISTDDIPPVNENNTLDEVENTYKKLNYRHESSRFSDLSNDLAGMGGSLVEWLFDGEKTYPFGLQPDLTGWSSAMQVKMRRHRYETSTALAEVAEKSGMGMWMRLFLDLVPSMVAHHKINKSKKLAEEREEKKNNLRQINSHITRLRNLPGEE